MKRWTALLLAVLMMFSLCACGSKSSGSSSDSAPSPEYTPNPDRCYGLFESDGTFLEVNEDGTAAIFNGIEQYCFEGSYVKDGDTATFTFEGSEYDGVVGTYTPDKYTWTLNDVDFSSGSVGGFFKCEATGEGFDMISDYTFTFYKDFSNESGKAVGVYERDGYAWKFKSAGFDGGFMMGVYDGHRWYFGDKEYEFTSEHLTTSLESLKLRWGFGTFVKGDEMAILCSEIGDLVDDGFKTDANLKQTVRSCGVCKIDVTYKKAAATILAVNPYEKEAPLSACIVGSFYTEDTGKVFQLSEDGYRCGEKNYDQLLTNDVYDYSVDRFSYHLGWISHNVSLGGGYGDLVLDDDSNPTLTLSYDGSTLKSFRFSYPGLLYSGLSENTDLEGLENMDEETIMAYITVRSNILSALKAAFAEENIDVSLNEKTGEITISDAVLFDVNSSTLSQEGREYIDRVMKVYAEVLLSDEFRSNISEILFEGHTDSNGDFGFNQTLSERRANAVLDYCLNECGTVSDADKSELSGIAQTKGHSCTDLIYDENGNEDAAASRRVAIRFFLDVQ